jgi:hypothetical protein
MDYMDRLSVDQLNDEVHFERLAEIKMTDLVGFIGQYYYKKFSPVIAFHYFISLLSLSAWLWVGWQTQSLDKLLASLGWGVLIFFILLPLHEWLHGITYQFFGAKDVRYRFIPAKMIAYAVAHNFVADRREFIWVALTPSIVINSLLIGFGFLFPQFQLIFLAALLMHIGGTSGDFALLNYLWVHRDREVFTYDDADLQVSYFYAVQK